jgi:hypothetical protein
MLLLRIHAVSQAYRFECSAQGPAIMPMPGPGMITLLARDAGELLKKILLEGMMSPPNTTLARMLHVSGTKYLLH